MAIMPGAHYAPIDYDGVPEMVRYDGVVFHTIVGHDPAPAAHFSVGSNGELTQNRDTEYQSAACLNGNRRLLAVETEDMGDPFPDWGGNDVPAWTNAQCDTNARICAWAHLTHGISLTEMLNSLSTSRGIGWHRLGIDGNFVPGIDYPGRVPGGEVWTRAFGKGCPGNRRIRQVKEKIISLARLIVSLPPAQRDRVIAGIEPIPSVSTEPITLEGEDVITVVTSATQPSSSAGLLLGSGRFFDITTDPTARQSAQVKINEKVWPELKVAAWTYENFRTAA